jgi:hypothetical protein
MTVLSILVVFAYFLSLLLRWSQNHSMVVGWPIILLGWTRRNIYMAVTFVLTYGSIIGIGYFFGIWVALAALAVKFIIGRISFHTYFKQAVAEHAEWEYQQMLKERGNATVPVENLNTMDRFMRIASPEIDFSMDESAMRQEAYRRAHQAIQDRVMRG